MPLSKLLLEILNFGFCLSSESGFLGVRVGEIILQQHTEMIS